MKKKRPGFSFFSIYLPFSLSLLFMSFYLSVNGTSELTRKSRCGDTQSRGVGVLRDGTHTIREIICPSFMSNKIRTLLLGN